jgi:hypothetical protein
VGASLAKRSLIRVVQKCESKILPSACPRTRARTKKMFEYENNNIYYQVLLKMTKDTISTFATEVVDEEL